MLRLKGVGSRAAHGRRIRGLRVEARNDVAELGRFSLFLQVPVPTVDIDAFVLCTTPPNRTLQFTIFSQIKHSNPTSLILSHIDMLSKADSTVTNISP